MKLYYSKGACSLAVRIVIHEIGIDCQFEEVDLKSKKLKNGDSFLAINPKGSVPVLLTDGDGVLTENAVIQQYLADLTRATQLLPELGQFKRYRVLEWLNFVSTELHKGAAPLFNPELPAEVKEQIVKPQLKKKLSFVAEHLTGKHFLLGDTFTLADAYLFVVLHWLQYFNVDIQEWPVLATYFAGLKKRKSVHQSLQEEGLV